MSSKSSSVSPAAKTTATRPDDNDNDDDDDDDDENQQEEASLSQLLAALAVGARSVQGLPLDDDFAYQASFPEFASQLASTKAALLDVLTMALPTDDLPPSDDLEDDPLLWEKCAEACDALLEDVEAYLELSKKATTKITTTTSQWENWSARARQRAQGSLGRLMEGLVDMVKPQITYNIVVQNDRLVPFCPRVHPDKPHSVTPLDLSLQPGHGLETRMASIKASSSTTTGTTATTAPTTTRYPDNLVAPSHHVGHVYQTEIEFFSYRPWQLQAHEPPKGLIPSSPAEALEATWIDTEAALEQLVTTKLVAARHIAIDLEAHSHRTFSGLTCLMQLSIRAVDSPNTMENYLLDPFALGATAVTTHLAGVLANPDIVKVMHGADWDIGWLQRDFGLYVVNLFDTGRAARALRFTSAGLAYLLHHYVGITAEKHHQLSDWRQRPLPPDMKQYAIQDTHYLLDIYERLLWDLEQSPDTSIVEVLDISRKVCLIRYDKEPFQPDGCRWLLAGRGRRQQQMLTPAQKRVLATLWDWRDQTARDCDESLLYVCPNPALLRLSLASPTTVTALQGVLNPIPPLLLRYAPNVVDRIKQALIIKEDDPMGDEGGDNNQKSVTIEAPTPAAATILEDDDDEVATTSSRSRQAPSSAYFKPAEMSSDRQDNLARGILSPVLGTEALYQQAGWMTPQNHPGTGGSRRRSDQDEENDERDMELVHTTTSEEDESDPSSKPKHLLLVDKANQNFKTADYMAHSLEMKVREQQQPGAATAAGRRRGRSIDGLGPTRAAREHSKSPTPKTVEEQARHAQQTAARVRISLSRKEDDLAMISPSTELNDDDDDDAEDAACPREQEGVDKDNGRTEEEVEEEFVIPRSLKEIYKISNQNRRNKKSSPTPERSGGVQGSETEIKALAKAEAVLQARGLNGKGYFDLGDTGNKRQRTKSTESESEDFTNASEANNNSNNSNNNSVTRDDDIAFMQDMGWIQSKEEAEKMLEQRQGERTEGGGPEGQGDDDNVEEDDNRRASTSSNSKSREGNNSNSNSSSKQPRQPSPAAAAFDYSSVGPIGAFPSQSSAPPANPFFSGAALTGGALTQGFGRAPDRKRTGGRGSGSGPRQQARPRERPEKKDGRTQVYKKK